MPNNTLELRKRLERLKAKEKAGEMDDIRLVLFASVLYGSRSENVFKPIPSEFLLPSKEPNFELLKDCFEKIVNETVEEVFSDEKTVSLLDHILNHSNIELNKTSLKAIECPELCSILSVAIARRSASRPQHMIKAVPKQMERRSFKMETFDKLKEELGSFYAFHGTKMQNVRSILEFGLINVFNERQVFGNGIYLTTDLSVTFGFSPFAENFYRESMFGEQLSAVILCEVIKHPLVTTEKGNKRIPQAYHIIPNSDWIRVDSVLLYTVKAKLITDAKPTQSNDSNVINGQVQDDSKAKQARWSWIPCDSGTVILLSLLVVLFGIGIIMTRESQPFKPI